MQNDKGRGIFQCLKGMLMMPDFYASQIDFYPWKQQKDIHRYVRATKVGKTHTLLKNTDIPH